MLAIDPEYILGREFSPQGNQENGDFAELIARRLPPNIKVLVLEGLVSPYSVPTHIADTDWTEAFPKKAEVLIEVLIEQKKVLTPGLKYVWVDIGAGETEIAE